MFTLKDTFNNCTISRHRSIETAVRAERKFSRAVKRSNGASSYIPTTILDNGNPLSDEQREQVESWRWMVSCGK